MDAAATALEAGLLRYSDGAVVGTGGFIEADGQRLNIRHVQPIRSPEDLGKVPVAERDGKTLRLADMGQVLVDPGPLFGDAVINDGPGLMLVVQKFHGANTMEVTRGVVCSTSSHRSRHSAALFSSVLVESAFSARSPGFRWRIVTGSPPRRVPWRITAVLGCSGCTPWRRPVRHWRWPTPLEA